jgi:hypothetical protein
VLWPVVVFVPCFIVGVWAAARWLPDLADGPVGSLAFFVTCGLVGAALAAVGLQVYTTVRYADTKFDGGVLVAGGLAEIMRDGGTLFALAAIVYLITPKAVAPEAVQPADVKPSP